MLIDYYQLREWMRAQPFEPFRLVMTDGKTFDVTAPSMLWPGRNTALYGLADNPAEPDVPARHMTLALAHIIRTGPIPVNTTG